MKIRLASVLLVTLLGGGAGAGCKSKTTSIDEQTQKDLAARRDVLLATRKKLSEDKAKIEAEIKTVEASGGDATGLKKKLSDVTEQQSEVLAGQISELSAKVDGIARSNSSDAPSSAALQAEVTRLEGLVNKLEAALRAANPGGGGSDLEAKLLAQMNTLTEKCGNSAGPAVVVQTAAPKGSNYTRAEVEPLLSKARANMSKKGLMISDLPGQAQGLEGEATKAMADGDWGRAYLAAAQLAGNVDAIKVDRDFVRAKMARLNARVSSAKLNESANAAMSAGLVEVSDKYSSGDFAAANRKINQMFASL
ncbi:MAG TPA: hypothetical protein PLF40_13655 [Kofleriaceae bacterium]|nr:hypothetical protein [Kofleriaceae bacterium]